ncbi:MAG: YajQ family cyclic di-GMP-binding protein [Chloroherpetonaceae bacterium]|nr:YajQ family cyclic di-GMP-binding protein [Chloroherpetonaceae bacterium]MDW8466322.1 YajQ family cyclic di-GMP-binding protein [Chloroherpetonaceae bacterium]
MATEHSFDIVSKIPMQELDNALNQARKEIQQRYDLKDTNSEILFNPKEMELTLQSASEFTLKSVIDVLQSKLIKRGISIKALEYGKLEPASHNSVRQKVKLKQGLSKEVSKKITAAIKDLKLKVQTQVQGDAIRVSGKQIDDLQAVQKHLLSLDFEVPLQFENYR